MSLNRIVFPLDYPSLADARAGAAKVAAYVGVLKVGLELFVKEGPAALAIGQEHGARVFADLKLHDIPETVERAIASLAPSGVRFVTVHAAGGAAMLSRAVERAQRDTNGRLMVLAVTVLTSLDDADVRAQGLPDRAGDHALRLAKLAFEAGVRGFVCSPAEVRALRAELGPEAVLVTPGVRPAGSAAQDQKRVATPAQAIADGADYIVVGRPIRDAADPALAAQAIAGEVAEGLAGRS
ncbi:MAG TPA: orotidine-5'-phosphate decarboxylase [Polyangiaceae bacterium]|nr:orotidine-5'-phosphate decarboxylase [Polyangiaceae bacterium]